MKTRIQVLSEGGRLVGVYVPPSTPPSDSKAPRVLGLRAGPKQKLSEIDVELTHAPKSAKEVDAFHAQLRKRLKLRK